MCRVLVIGCSGSGKSTLARQISEACSARYIDTDALYWEAGWTPVPADEVVRKLPLSSGSWVIDGNFAGFRDEVWRRADCIVWLKHPRWRVMWRVTRRNLKWWLTRERRWSGNQMTLGHALSGIRFAWSRYAEIRRSYPQYLDERRDQAVYVLGAPQECAAWIAQVREGGDTFFK